MFNALFVTTVISFLITLYATGYVIVQIERKGNNCERHV